MLEPFSGKGHLEEGPGLEEQLSSAWAMSFEDVKIEVLSRHN